MANPEAESALWTSHNSVPRYVTHYGDWRLAKQPEGPAYCVATADGRIQWRKDGCGSQ
jgi:hypothetical protein